MNKLSLTPYGFGVPIIINNFSNYLRHNAINIKHSRELNNWAFFFKSNNADLSKIRKQIV